ncbi:hypothetical protein [Falsiroseomonas sp. HW251]|uniref:hypothetical protein n=1 Tax=Falsiroseomonas sp. HW251 TaxID=3390998 RepID=UPI003D3123BA
MNPLDACPNALPFNDSVFGSVSRRLAKAVFARLPKLRRHAFVVQSEDEPDGLTLVIRVQPPCGATDRPMAIWVCQGNPSIGYGPEHTHECPTDRGIAWVVDWAAAILRDDVVIMQDFGWVADEGAWIDLRKPDALLEELTHPCSSGRIRLRTWSGWGDREVCLADFT